MKEIAKLNSIWLGGLKEVEEHDERVEEKKDKVNEVNKQEGNLKHI